MVKQRDGRPIKIEGNAESTLFGNGTCATGQATVLSLYDDARFRGPVWRGQPAKWDELDQRVLDSLVEARAGHRKVALLSSTINSPSTLRIIAQFSQQHPNFTHVMYDPASYSGIRAANASSFGRAVIPHYAFDKARVILSLDYDFLARDVALTGGICPSIRGGAKTRRESLPPRSIRIRSFGDWK